jgi:hypothetical protein
MAWGKLSENPLGATDKRAAVVLAASSKENCRGFKVFWEESQIPYRAKVAQVCISYAGIRAALGMMRDQANTAGEKVTENSSAVSVAVEEPKYEAEVVPERENGSSAETAEDAAATVVPPETDVPSLDEYLSLFTCGSCHRNCLLANPRCRNGSRLADAKAEQYYVIYG